MSEMFRLRELAALLQPKHLPVAEAKIPPGFAGLKQVVEDALADLFDKLGEGGALETMMQKSGVEDKIADQTISAVTKAFETFKKEVEAALTDAEFMIDAVDDTVKENITEMAKSHAYHGSWGRDRKAARDMIKSFRAGEDDFELENGDKYVFEKATNGGALKKGDVVFAVHDRTNTGAELYEVLGFGPEDDPKHGTVKDALKAAGVTSLKELEKWNKEHKDDEIRLHVKDIDDGSSGAWFYLFEGRWSYGSGAEPLTFSLVKKV